MSKHEQTNEIRLVRGKIWYIEYHDPTRRRVTFDLNRAKYRKDPAAREAYALQKLAEIQKQIVPEAKNPKPVTVLEAIDMALVVKLKSDREYTHSTYRSQHGIFCTYLREKGLGDLPATAFSKQMAMKYLDWVLLEKPTKEGKGVSNRTYNNYITNHRALWTEVVEREIVPRNPFSKITERKPEQKKRIVIDADERDVIIADVYQAHKPLFLSIILLTYCMIRIAEMRRLRFCDIDLETGVISMSGSQTKNREIGVVTIPADIIQVIAPYVEAQPPRWLIFGEYCKPHPTKPCGRNTLTWQFREHLIRLEKAGKIRSRVGYSLYSWKDTGGMAMVKAGLDIITIQSHFRHKDLGTTQVYLQSLGVVKKDIRALPSTVFKLPLE
jgi:integrase